MLLRVRKNKEEVFDNSLHNSGRKRKSELKIMHFFET